MLTHQSPVTELKTEKAMPQEPSQQFYNLTLALVHSMTLQGGTELPL